MFTDFTLFSLRASSGPEKIFLKRMLTFLGTVLDIDMDQPTG
jgi:hypothetical protein